MKKTKLFKEYSNLVTYKIDAKESDYLYIKKSSIPGAGIGLFTAIPLYKDEVISVFNGELLTPREAKIRAMNGEDSYFMELPDATIMDSKNTWCFAKFANDALGCVKTKYKINSVITLDELGHICIVANRNIKSGEEIFCCYGSNYWKNYRNAKNVSQNIDKP